jgi:hypothetical protein
LTGNSELPGELYLRQAKLFSDPVKLSSIHVRVNSEAIPAVFYDNGPPGGFPTVYTDLGLNHDALVHLALIGLLYYTSPFLTKQVREYDLPVVNLDYFGDQRTFQMPRAEPPSEKYALNYGVVGLTRVGRELARIAGAEPVGGFFDFLEAEWAKAGVCVSLPPVASILLWRCNEQDRIGRSRRLRHRHQICQGFLNLPHLFVCQLSNFLAKLVRINWRNGLDIHPGVFF